MWLHKWVRTPYVKACVISAHFSRTVWKEIATLLSSLPLFFSLSPSFALLLPPLCLCPWWPSCWVVCLTALTPCAWADVNSLMVSVLLLLWQAFLHSADVRRAPAEVERTEGSRRACVSAERGGNIWNIWEHLCTSSAARKLVGTSVEAQVQQECSAVHRCCSGPLTYISIALLHCVFVSGNTPQPCFCQQGQGAEAGFSPGHWGTNSVWTN